MGTTEQLLTEVRHAIDAHKEPLTAARDRLALVRDAATTFPGALRTYASGSLAMHTMNHPVTDGDGGLVLDRRHYPALGPDGDGDAPHDVTQALCDCIGPKIRETYPGAVISKSKRGPKVHFHSPVPELHWDPDTGEQDPTVDLVVALTRKNGNGIWIPNLHTDDWEPSDPEKHVELIGSGSDSHSQTCRRVIRLAKAWNKQYTEPGVSSFMLSVWGYEFVTPGMGIATGLQALFHGAASRLRDDQPTPDPAGVSDNLKPLLARDTVLTRLANAESGITKALEHDGDRETVRQALATVYWKYLPDELSAAADTIAQRQPLPASRLGIQGISAFANPTRSWGSV
jgi:hypothetical protein